MPIKVRSKRRAAPAPERPVTAKKGELPFGLPQPPPGTAQKPAGISLCMIVKNEERFLEQCLRSVQDVVDEMVIVDTGSSDRTIEIAKSFGATVIEREWRDDFAWARNQALEAATKRWILILDADEELMQNSKAPLRQLKSAPAYDRAVWVRLYNKSDDYQGTGDMSHALIRIFPNSDEIRYRGLIHEFPTVNGDPNGLQGVTSPIGIIHHGYVKEVVHSRSKGERNLAIVRAAAEKDPNDPYNWFNLGATAFLVDDFVTARDALERMRSMVGSQKRGFMPNGLAVLAETYCDKLGDPEKGEEVSRIALEISPHYANAHFQLGKALVAQKRFDEAREAYEAAIDDGKYAAMQFVIDDQVYIWKAHSEIGSSYVMEKNDEKALEWFDKGLKNAPKAEPLHINRAKALERLGRIQEAGEGYRTVYEMYRGEHATIEYINYLLRNQRESDAVAVIEESYAKLSPGNAVPVLMAAAAVAQRKKSLDDERYLLAAAEIAPGLADVLNPLEAILRERGKEQVLQAVIAREETVEPQNAADFVRRSRRHAMEGRNEIALQLADRGLAQWPKDAWLLYFSGLALSAMGRNGDALERLESIDEATGVVLIPALTLMGMLRSARGDAQGALHAVDRALEIDPNHVDALVVRAKAMEALGNDAEYEATMNRAFEVDPARIAIELSSYYLRKQRFADAAAIADRALQKR